MWLEKALIATWNAGPFVFGGQLIIGVLLILIKKAEPKIDMFIKTRFKKAKTIEKISDWIIKIANRIGWFMVIKNGLFIIAWLVIHFAPKAYKWIVPYWNELLWKFFHQLPGQFPGM